MNRPSKNDFSAMPGAFPGSRLTCLATARSTNDEARERKLRHGDIVLAEEQTAGRGQRGNSWESHPGKNMTFSLMLEPDFLPAELQFYLSEVISLAVTDTLREEGFDARIKWPNDIYVGDRKICGILIENDLYGRKLARSIAGIGINVNQKTFSEGVPNPVSLYQLSGGEYDRGELLQRFCTHLRERYRTLEEGDTNTLEKDYHAVLYRLGVPARYALPNGSDFTGIIRRVEPTGELIVEHPDGTQMSYLFKEIGFIVP